MFSPNLLRCFDRWRHTYNCGPTHPREYDNRHIHVALRSLTNTIERSFLIAKANRSNSTRFSSRKPPATRANG